MAKILGMVLLILLALGGVVFADSMLSSEQMQEDLGFVVDLIQRVHPDPFHAISKSEFEDRLTQLRESLQQPMSREQFFFVLTPIVMALQDGHTQVFFPSESEFLPARFYWAEDGLVVVEAAPGSGLQPMDQVLAIGGTPVDELLPKLALVVPAENPYALKVNAGMRLPSAALLSHLGLVEENRVNVLVEDEKGSQRSEIIALAGHAGATETEREFFGWRFYDEMSLGFFWLDQCLNTVEYQQALEEFFGQVAEAGIEHVVLDVRQNTGGSSGVINEFFRYLPVKRVPGFAGEIRYSPEAAEQRGYSRTIGYQRESRFVRLFGGYNMNISAPPSSELVFGGQLYVLTSPRTFSSGNWFAVLVQDNGFGLVVGEPTGNAPTSFGDVLSFRTPNSDFSLIISHKRWIRPDRSRDPSDALYPDIAAFTTVDSIRAGSDPQLEAIFQHITGNKGATQL